MEQHWSRVFGRYCQKNGRRSVFESSVVASGDEKLTPFGYRSIATFLEICSADKMALMAEMVVGLRMNGGEFLQTLAAPKTLHCPFSSSKRLMRILSPIVLSMAGFLPFEVADFLHRRAI